MRSTGSGAFPLAQSPSPPQQLPKDSPDVRGNVAPDQCQGKVGNLYVYQNGDVNAWMTFRNDWLLICNLDGKAGKTEAVCRSWLALLMAAYQNNEDVVILFPGGGVKCESIPIYDKTPPVGYVRTKR